MLRQVVEVVGVAEVIKGFDNEVGGKVGEGAVIFFTGINAFIMIRTLEVGLSWEA